MSSTRQCLDYYAPFDICLLLLQSSKRFVVRYNKLLFNILPSSLLMKNDGLYLDNISVGDILASATRTLEEIPHYFK